MRKRRGLWIVYGVCAAAVVTAMAWLTSTLLALERAQAESAADAAHQESLRLSLWRMDSWLAPRLVVETSLDADTFYSAMFLRKRHDVQAGWIPTPELASLESYEHLRELLFRLQADANDLMQVRGETKPPRPSKGNDLAQRADLNSMTQNAAGNYVVQITSGFRQPTGPLLPLWTTSSTGERSLVFVRRVFEFDPTETRSNFPPMPGTLGDTGKMQVFVADWPMLRSQLFAQIRDRLPDADLRAPTSAADPLVAAGWVLASAPIVLDAPRPPATLQDVTPARIILLVSWLSIAGSLIAVGITLKRTVDLSDRRSRFASSVTHELRTPLTTFRLYSEMLADGMVTDPSQRQVYLETLKSESSRLAALVENVLAYARVEEGRMPLARERMTVTSLLTRLVPPLERRALECGMTLSVETGAAAASVVDVDPNVVGQILFNLVDNACKYSEISPGREISLQAARRSAAAVITVTDHGPGIPPDRVRAAFTPFERAGRPAGDTIPGIGLGLALSRALARDLGGDLDYEPAPGGGACFVLTLPVARDARS